MILSMLAFVPSMAIATPAVLVCFVTPVVAVACIRATPRLAIATLYWSAATFLAGPGIVNLEVWAISCLALVGLILLIGLAVHYGEKA
ncbi:MAG: hypothetical protein OXH68_17035 [Gammaproteobacteria bacterium]|nr:hypothetical protein [Gammaproteobacteria bacterium]